MSDGDDKNDLTRIEDLSEYLHQDDTSVDRQLDAWGQGDQASLSDLPDDDEPELPATPLEEFDEDKVDFDDSSDDLPPAFSAENTEVISTESIGDLDEEDNNESDDFSFGEESTFDSSDEDESSFSFENTDVDNESSDDSSDFSFEDSEVSSFGDDSEDSSFGDNSEESTFGDTSEDGNEDNFSFESTEEVDTSFESDNMEEVSKEMPESEPEPEPEPIVEEPEVEIAKSSYNPERFEDVKEFGKNISYGAMAQGGNPAFSVMVRGIKYKEECEEIFDILKSHSLVTQDSENTIRQGLDNGSLLISQLSEYSAIYLAHKMRRFDLELHVGLSDEINPSESYSNLTDKPVNKDTLFQNKTESLEIVDKIAIESVLVSTTPNLDGYKIDRYLGVLTEHALIDQENLSRLEHIGEHENTERFSSVEDTYDSLIEKLKAKALSKGGNAILSLNFTMNQLPESITEKNQTFKITATTNLVWASGL